jgi:hypothetical protein
LQAIEEEARINRKSNSIANMEMKANLNSKGGVLNE